LFGFITALIIAVPMVGICALVFEFFSERHSLLAAITATSFCFLLMCGFMFCVFAWLAIQQQKALPPEVAQPPKVEPPKPELSENERELEKLLDKNRASSK
jgi:hypothetical protein